MKGIKLKVILGRVLHRVQPLAHRLPRCVRHPLGEMLWRLSRGSMRRPPEPYQPGAYPMGVNLFGLFRAEMGLAQGARLYANALSCGRIPHTLLNLDFMPWLPQNDHSMDDQLTDAPVYAVNVIHINPNQWQEACYPFGPQAFDRRYNIGVWLWELETIPQSWRPMLDYVDEVWAPSEFIASALRRETDKPVTVIPYGITVPVDGTATRRALGLPEDRFCVLVMYDSNSYASRKNPGAAIRAYTQAFGRNSPDTHLVIKVNHPKAEDLAFFERELGAQGGYTLITDQMEKPRLNALIRLCDVYVSLHRSEGFGLVMAEAMALGTPVVATAWSANTEFMTGQTACLVDCTLVPVQDQYEYEDDAFRWAEDDVQQAAAYLKRLHEDRAFYQEKAACGKAWIEEHLSPEASAGRMRQRLEAIGRVRPSRD